MVYWEAMRRWRKENVWVDGDAHIAHSGCMYIYLFAKYYRV